MRAALVGCGHIAESHWRALQRLSGVDLVALCDRDGVRAAEFARARGARDVFVDLDRMIRERRPDVVHILTPPATHPDLAVQAMEAGCHVLVEKPMAVTTAGAERMARVAEETDRYLGVCHNYRLVPSFQKGLRLNEAGRLGRVRSVEVFWKTTYTPQARSGASTWIDALPSGVFHEVGPHLVYLALAFAPGLRLSAVVLGSDEGANDELRALFDSVIGPVTLGISVATSPVQKFVRVYGTKLSLHIDLATSVLTRLRGRADGMVPRAMVNLETAWQVGAGTIGNAVLTSLGRLPRGHDTLVRRFYEAVRTGGSPPSGFEEGLAVTAVLEEVWRAIESTAKPEC